MTLDQLQRAQLVVFAFQEAIATGTLDAMKAVCYVIRNRVRAGWHDGSWLDVMEHADEVSGNEPIPRTKIDVYSRVFQMLMQSVDDIYYASADDNAQKVVDKALYYQFMDKPLRPWFNEAILRNPASHPRRAHIGPMVLFD
jgi:hypothetical protein